jgi:hypothetical protein
MYPFFQRSHAKFSTSRRSLHTLAQFLMVQLLPLQEPCAVKVAFEEGYQYEFD